MGQRYRMELFERVILNGRDYDFIVDHDEEVIRMRKDLPPDRAALAGIVSASRDGRLPMVHIKQDEPT